MTPVRPVSGPAVAAVAARLERHAIHGGGLTCLALRPMLGPGVPIPAELALGRLSPRVSGPWSVTGRGWIVLVDDDGDDSVTTALVAHAVATARRVLSAPLLRGHVRAAPGERDAAVLIDRAFGAIAC